MVGKEFNDLCIKLTYELPVEFTANVTDINCANGLSTILITNKKDKKCADVVLSCQSSSYAITNVNSINVRTVTIIYKGKLDKDIKLHKSELNISCVAQYITMYT